MAEINLNKNETMKVLRRLLFDIKTYRDTINIKTEDGYQYIVNEYEVSVHPEGVFITVIFGEDNTTIPSENLAYRPLIMEILEELIEIVDGVETKRKKVFLAGLGL